MKDTLYITIPIIPTYNERDSIERVVNIFQTDSDRQTTADGFGKRGIITMNIIINAAGDRVDRRGLAEFLLQKRSNWLYC